MRLHIENLKIWRGGGVVFSQLDAMVKTGEILLVRGANGLGKSTLLRAIAGLHNIQEKGNAGRIFINHQGKIYPTPPFIHYLGHDNAMKAHLSVIDNLRFWAGFYGVKPVHLQTIFDSVGLDGLAHLSPQMLSTGQRRRLGFARLLLCERPLWLLDEPDSGMDQSGRDFIACQMHNHLGRGGMIVAASHVPLGITAHHVVDLESCQEGGSI